MVSASALSSGGLSSSAQVDRNSYRGNYEPDQPLQNEVAVNDIGLVEMNTDEGQKKSCCKCCNEECCSKCYGGTLLLVNYLISTAGSLVI